MKSLPLVFLLYWSFVLQAQDVVAVGEQPHLARLHIMGKLTDGRPALPAAPGVIPRLVVKQSFTGAVDYKKSRGASAKGAVHEVIDPQLPVLEKPIAPRMMTREELVAFRQSPRYAELAARIAKRKKMRMVMLSATVYDEKCTLLRWWAEGKSFQAWSNVNFAHLGGCSSFVKGDQEYMLFMGIGAVDTVKWGQRYAAAGRKWKAPTIPRLPNSAEKNPAFSLVGKMPSVEELAPITALHELYLQEHKQLRQAHADRVMAQREKEVELLRNPPQPQVPQIYFWRGKRNEDTAVSPATPDSETK